MGVKLDVSDVTNELYRMNLEISQTGYYVRVLKEKLSNYINNYYLKSETYDVHKKYVELIHLPVLDGADLLCELLLDANQKYISSLNQFFGEVGYIDEEKWILEYDSLMKMYNWLNQEAESLANLVNTKGVKSDFIIKNNKKLKNKAAILEGELTILYEVLNALKKNIEKIPIFLNEIGYIYALSDSLKNSLNLAVGQMNNINYSYSGDDFLNLVDYTPYKELINTTNNTIISLEIQKEIEEQLGSLNGYEDLSDEKKLEYVNDIYNIVKKYIPDLAASTNIGHVEVFVFPCMKVYFDVSLEGKIENEEQHLEVQATLNQNDIDLAGLEFASGNVELRNELDNYIGISVSYEIDDNTQGYLDISFGNFIMSFDVETGVKTKIGQNDSQSNSDIYDLKGLYVTTAAGIKTLNPVCYEPEYSLDSVYEPKDLPYIPDTMEITNEYYINTNNIKNHTDIIPVLFLPENIPNIIF